MAEIIVDNGSVAKVCPPECGLEFGYTGEAPSTWRNVQFEPIKCYGVRDVNLRLEPDSGSWIDEVIKFDMANVAYPVLRVAKMLQNGSTSVFD